MHKVADQSIEREVTGEPLADAALSEQIAHHLVLAASIVKSRVWKMMRLSPRVRLLFSLCFRERESVGIFTQLRAAQGGGSAMKKTTIWVLVALCVAAGGVYALGGDWVGNTSTTKLDPGSSASGVGG